MANKSPRTRGKLYLYWLGNLFMLVGVVLLLLLATVYVRGYYMQWQIEQQSSEWNQEKQAVLSTVPFATAAPAANLTEQGSATATPMPTDAPSPTPATIAQNNPNPTETANVQKQSEQPVLSTPTPMPPPIPTAVPATPTPAPTPVPYRFPPATRMVIPRIDLDSTIVDMGMEHKVENGVDEWIPMTAANAVAHYNWTANAGEGGNAVFSGHISSRHEGNVFTNLDQLRPGDDIIIYTGNRGILYKVVDRVIVKPEQVEYMNPTKEPTATLITCYPDWVYTDRLIVIARLVGPAP